MELAFLLIVLVIAELVLTVFLLARHKMYNKNIEGLSKRCLRLERNVKKLAEVINDMSNGVNIEDGLQGATADSLSDLVTAATPEDIEKANEILKQLGVGGN